MTDYSTVKTMSVEDAKAQGLFITIGAEADDAYMAALKEQIQATGIASTSTGRS